MKPRPITDPVEFIIANALQNTGVAFRHEIPRPVGSIDFEVLENGLLLECKQFYTPRSNDLLQREPNIILIQGREAATKLGTLLVKLRAPQPRGDDK